MDGSIYPFFNDADETKAMRDRLKSWFEERLGADVPLFSFCLDGKQSYIYIGNWQKMWRCAKATREVSIR